MRVQAFVGAVALALVACSTTVKPDEGFSPAAGEAYVVIAADGMAPHAVESHTFKFQRVDLASMTFRREGAYVRFGHKQFSGGGDEYQRADGKVSASTRFAGTKILPGDYALVSQHIHTSLGISSMINDNCYSRGAAIYRFREGAVNIVRLGTPRDVASGLYGGLGVVEVRDPAALQAQVTEVLAGYPKLTGPRVVASLLGSAAFEGKKCRTTGAFSFTRAPGVSVDW